MSRHAWRADMKVTCRSCGTSTFLLSRDGVFLLPTRHARRTCTAVQLQSSVLITLAAEESAGIIVTMADVRDRLARFGLGSLGNLALVDG